MNSQNQQNQPAAGGQPDCGPFVFHFFSSNRSADFLREAVLCVRNVFPHARIVVIHESTESSSREIRDFLEGEMKVEWRKGQFEEHSHFMGQESIRNLVDQMLSSSRDEGDILIRMRPDSMLLNPGFLERFRKGGAELCAAVFQSGFVYNGFYAIKTPALKKMAEYLQNHPLKDNAPESGVILDAFKAVSPSPKTMQLCQPWCRDRSAFVWGNYNWTMCPPPSHLSYVDLLSISKRFQKDIGFFGRISLMKALRQGFQDLREQKMSEIIESAS